MSGRARLGVAREALGAWLLGGLCFWALGGLCGLGAAAPGARAGGAPGTPRPCQAPQQWEGRQVLYRQSSGRNSRALLSYDGLNERVRVLDERKALIPCKRSHLRGRHAECMYFKNSCCSFKGIGQPCKRCGESRRISPTSSSPCYNY
nr:mammalian ependymin-related protein 1 isoform X2 [Mirounga angustirostris]